MKIHATEKSDEIVFIAAWQHITTTNGDKVLVDIYFPFRRILGVFCFCSHRLFFRNREKMDDTLQLYCNGGCSLVTTSAWMRLRCMERPLTCWARKQDTKYFTVQRTTKKMRRQAQVQGVFIQILRLEPLEVRILILPTKSTKYYISWKKCQLSIIY